MSIEKSIQVNAAYEKEELDTRNELHRQIGILKAAIARQAHVSDGLCLWRDDTNCAKGNDCTRENCIWMGVNFASY